MLGMLAAGVAGYGLAESSSSSEPEPPERMSYDQALKQAEDALQPQYEKSKEKTMSNVNNNLINRGFYGQAPGDALRANTMADMEADYRGQVANYANNLQNERYTQDYQTYQTNLQQANQPDPFWQGIGSIAGSFMGGPGGEAVANKAMDWLS